MDIYHLTPVTFRAVYGVSRIYALFLFGGASEKGGRFNLIHAINMEIFYSMLGNVISRYDNVYTDRICDMESANQK